MKKTKEQNAITLIALIITIVVLLILAVVAINAVTGDGIIQHATNARDSYENAQAKEQSVLSYYETYLQTEGQTGKWIQTGETIERTNTEGITEKVPVIKKVNEDGTVQTIVVGDYVVYNPLKDEHNNDVKASYISYGSLENENNKNGKASGFDGDIDSNGAVDISADQQFNITYNGTWQVLGIENGNILLVSSNNIANTYYIRGQVGYQYGIDELNGICSIYGKGAGAESARSINAEDINKLTVYDPEIGKWASDLVYGYGITTTFSMSENSKVQYENSNTTLKETPHSTCIYFEDGRWNTLGVDKQTVSVRSEAYRYYPETLTEAYDDDKIGIVQKNSTIWNMLFKNTNSDSQHPYYLYAPYVGGGDSICYGTLQITGEHVSNVIFYKSYNEIKTITRGVRAVVKLKANVELKDSNNDKRLEINL